MNICFGFFSNMDLLNAEKSELDVMIDKGVEFKIPKRSIFRFLGKKERTFTINQPYLGTLDLLSAEFIKIDFDEERLKNDGLSESKLLASRSCKVLANILAISVLNSKIKIRLFKWILSNYFLWRVTPKKMLDLSLVINYMMNLEGFINSIRLNAVNRTASPTLIEMTQNN